MPCSRPLARGCVLCYVYAYNVCITSKVTRHLGTHKKEVSERATKYIYMKYQVPYHRAVVAFISFDIVRNNMKILLPRKIIKCDSTAPEEIKTPLSVCSCCWGLRQTIVVNSTKCAQDSGQDSAVSFRSEHVVHNCISRSRISFWCFSCIPSQAPFSFLRGCLRSNSCRSSRFSFARACSRPCSAWRSVRKKPPQSSVLCLFRTLRVVNLRYLI